MSFSDILIGLAIAALFVVPAVAWPRVSRASVGRALNEYRRRTGQIARST
jgi:hypothetical protein